MDRPCATSVLSKMLREQVCCLGRIVARHQVPDDVVWEIAKGFDVIYQRLRGEVELKVTEAETAPPSHRAVPHPGLTYLLDKLRMEATAQASDMR